MATETDEHKPMMTEEEVAEAQEAQRQAENEDQSLIEWAEAMEMAAGLQPDKLPTDEEYADRYGHVMLQLDDEEERLKAQYERHVARIKKRRLSFNARHLVNVEAAVNRLLDKAQGSRKTRPKSVQLERCAVGFRLQPVKVEFTAEEDVRKFAEKHEYAAECYAVVDVPTVKIDRKALKSAVDTFASKNTGAMPHGIELTGGGDKLYVKDPTQ